MIYRYTALKTSWGIAIFLELKEIINPSMQLSDTKITDNIYLRIEDTSNLNEETAIQWIGNGVKSLAKQIEDRIGDNTVCFVVSMLDFAHPDFQEEGLYCAARGWLAKYYNLEIPEIKFRYDKENNKYIFDIPELDNLGGSIQH